MTTPSPAPSNNSNDTAASSSTITPTTTTTTTTTIKTISPAKSISAFAIQRDPPKTLRGLNKPKCSQCGNVARSRCPYLSCKSCCAKAENPCPIHVLKKSATLPEKKPASTSLFDQKSTDASSQGSSLRVTHIRQLSQFNGTQVPFRARRPLTRKDAAALNQWRFAKLKEYKERNIDAENEAFDRYMQNVSLLDETFSVNCSPPLMDEMSVHDSITTSKEDNTRRMVLGLKSQLRSNPWRADSFKRRIQDIVDQGLKKLRKWNDNEEPTDANDVDDLKEVKRLRKTESSCAERSSAIDELIEKLNKARNEEELQSCLDMKFQLFNQHEKACSTEKNVVETSEQISKDEACSTEKNVVETSEQISKDAPTLTHLSNYLPPRLWSKVEVDQGALHAMDMHFSSLDQIEDL